MEDYAITNGKTYLRIGVNNNPAPCSKELADRLTEQKAKEILSSLPRTMKNLGYKVVKLENNVATEKKSLKREVKIETNEDLKVLDDHYKDYKEPDTYNDNPQVYVKRTFVEENIKDVPSMLKDMVIIISELDMYVENMRYLERELDLKILDIRHFIRDHETKLGTVQMAKVGYLLQSFERDRAKIKMNKNCAMLFVNNLDAFKQEGTIKMIDTVENSEYRYRRINPEQIWELAKDKKVEENDKNLMNFVEKYA